MRVLRAGGMALVSVGMFVGLLGGSALAETRIIKLSGLDEVPVVITGATGELRLKIPRDELSIEYTLSYEGIEGGPVLQAHIHLGQEHTATASNIVVFLCTNIGGAPVSPPANPTPECPAGPDGEVTGTLIPANVIPRPAQGVGTDDLAAVIEAIRKGVAYGNVHSTGSPSGEIRANFHGSH
jgi:CHRD domain